ncbi:MAG TPA: TlpA disulfide reductase family protein [Candidatus Aquilonibacter sp.]|nr:TlpA disulfide reductase family protein [Candidatus Aquilonibacter sp.]
MRRVALALLLALIALPAVSQDDKPQDAGPTNEKAQKSYKEGLEYLKRRDYLAALDNFKKADKQDGGHCRACQEKMKKYGTELHDWKAVETACEELIAEAETDKEKAIAHYSFGISLIEEGNEKHKSEDNARAHDEFAKALAIQANFPQAIFWDGRALGMMNKDDAAKAQFQLFLKVSKPDDPKRQRAQRYIDDPDLVRARMAPAFSVTTIDGQHVSLDDLEGKVVLIDFWATWCGPCREALPHVHKIAQKFEGQPLVILSVSLDSDDQKWRDFVAKDGMTWLNYRDGYFKGPVATLYGVDAIPHTFTIDSDGVLQEEHVGDASLEGKLKKLIARANATQGQQSK